MSKIIRDVRSKLNCGQNIFRRSTVEKILSEYDRLLMRNAALEKQATQQNTQVVTPGDLLMPQKYINREQWKE